MWKRKTVIFLLAFCTLVNSRENCSETCSSRKSQDSGNKGTLVKVYTGNPTYVITKDQNNNFKFIPKSNLKISLRPSEKLSDDQSSYSHDLIFIVQPSTKNRTCDPNSSKTETTTVPTNLSTADVSTSPPVNTLVTTVHPPIVELSSPAMKTTVKPSSIPPSLITVIPSTQKITAPTIATTKQTPSSNCSKVQPDEKTKYPPNLSTTKNPTNTMLPHTKEPNTWSTPTKVIPTRNPRERSGDMNCLNDGMYRADNFTCDQYYVCINGIRYLMDCPYGLVFNDVLKVCDWLENVEGCYPPVFNEISCPDEGYGFDDKSILKFRYRDSCSQYVACHKRKPRLLTCGEGHSFEENSGDCVNLKIVGNCKNVHYSH